MNKLIKDLHSSLVIFRYHHLFTHSKATHDACEFYYSTMGEQLDTLAECLMGSYTNNDLQKPSIIEIEMLEERQCLKRLLIQIEDIQPNVVSEIQSQLDDIKNTINKTFYLIDLE